MTGRKAILLFIPGNPGIDAYYTSFFAALRRGCPGLDIISANHVGFNENDARRPVSQIDLDAQIAHKVDLLEGIVLGLTDSEKASRVPIYVAGHSVGSYIAIRLLALRGDVIQRAYLLFPTLSHIAQSPQGVIATAALRVPGCVTALTALAYLLSWVPRKQRHGMVQWFTQFPEDAVLVTADRVLRPSAVYSALTLARSEMAEIRDPDEVFWKTYGERCSAYWATNDRWVSDAHRLELLGIAHGMESHHCETAPHAFCIRHSDMVAKKVVEWLNRDIALFKAKDSRK